MTIEEVTGKDSRVLYYNFTEQEKEQQSLVAPSKKSHVDLSLPLDKIWFPKNFLIVFMASDITLTKDAMGITRFCRLIDFTSQPIPIPQPKFTIDFSSSSVDTLIRVATRLQWSG